MVGQGGAGFRILLTEDSSILSPLASLPWPVIKPNAHALSVSRPVANRQSASFVAKFDSPAGLSARSTLPKSARSGARPRPCAAHLTLSFCSLSSLPPIANRQSRGFHKSQFHRTAIGAIGLLALVFARCGPFRLLIRAVVCIPSVLPLAVLVMP